MTVRVRFAPSPTGHLHIGGARTALFNWLFARNLGGTFVLRIEDTDTERSTAEYTNSIMDGMRWLGLNWDEGPYHQMERMPIYLEHVDNLVRTGKAYPCYCSPDTLSNKRKQALAEGRKPTYDRTCRERTTPGNGPHCIRFKAPLTGTTVLHDLVRGDISFDNRELDDLVILRSNGVPTYNLTVVVDDVTMNITHIIRGDDHINNTPRQMLLYNALDYQTPTFAHLPMILGSDNKRLSKRHGATSVVAYRDMGYLPQALLNYLARLGWSYGDQEIFTLEEMTKCFSFDHVGKAAAIFNPGKLDWVNSEHLKGYSDHELVSLTEPFLAEMGLTITDPDYAARAVATERARAKTLREMAQISAFYFRDQIIWDDKAVRKWLNPKGKDVLNEVASIIRDLPNFDEGSLKTALEGIVAARGCKFLHIAQPLRVAMTGTTVSPGIYEVMTTLGRDRVLKRIERALSTAAPSAA